MRDLRGLEFDVLCTLRRRPEVSDKMSEQQEQSKETPTAAPSHEGSAGTPPAENAGASPRQGDGADAGGRASRQAAWGVLGFLAALAVGFVAGKWIQRPDPAVAVATGERVRVALRGDEPQIGPDDAWVTVVEFADFECPYCAKGAKPLAEAIDGMDEGDVRLIFKHYPLPFHRKAVAAARAAYAAHKIGKFWELHDWLYARRGDVVDLRGHLASMGIDPDPFLEVMFSDEAMAAIDDDMIAGGKAGVSGTPAYVVNGHLYAGAKTKDQWIAILEGEKAQAQELGVPRSKVYEALMRNAKDRIGDGNPVGGKPSARGPARRPGEADVSVRYRVPVDGREPTIGSDDSLVTIVLFSDFRCPFCRRLAPVIERLVEENDDVRVVFRNFPLPSHPGAKEAARAALAAHRQGKFWPMHDVLFAHVGPLTRESIDSLAAEIGLDLEKFRADLEDPAIAEAVDADLSLGRRFGVVATPTMFVNGRYVRGAQTTKTMEQVLENARREAREVLERVAEGGSPYERIVAEGLDRVAEAATEASAP